MEGGCNKDVPLPANHSHRCGRRAANQNSSHEREAAWEMALAASTNV